MALLNETHIKWIPKNMDIIKKQLVAFANGQKGDIPSFAKVI